MSKLIFYLIVGLVSTFGFCYVYCKSCDRDLILNAKTVTVYLLTVIIFSSIKYFELNSISIFAYFIFYPFVFYFLKPQPLKNLFFYLIIVWFYGMCLDLLSMLIISGFIYIFDLDFSYHWQAEIMTFFVFICMILIGRSKKIKKLTNSLLKILNKIKFSDFNLTLFTLFIFLVGLTLFAYIDRLNISLLLFLVIFSILIDFVFLILYKSNSAETAKFIQFLRENNQFYMHVDDENRIFKHNLLAKLLSIKSVSNKKARLLIDDLIKEFNSNIGFIDHIKDIPYGLNGIIYQKIYSYLDKIEIKIDNRISYDVFEVLTARRYNVLVEKMVIALDNAIESTLKSFSKLLIIDLYQEDDKIIVEIKNTFANNINIDELGKANYSTKGKKRGLGLFSALRNKEVAMSVKIINDMFVSKLIAIKNK